MKRFEMIQHFENVFDSMMPAMEKSKETFAWFSGIPDSSLNMVMHLFCDAGTVEKKIDELLQKTPSGIFPSFWIHSENRAEGLVEALKERGFKPASAFPVMIWDVQEVSQKPHFDVRVADLNIFWQILGVTFQMNETLLNGWQIFLPKAHAESYLVYLDGEPVGTGTLILDGNVGVIANIATLPKFQKRGCGRSMMLFLMNRAYELKLEHLILGGAPMSEKLYSELGFKKEFVIEVYSHDQN